MGKNVIIFRGDMRSAVHINHKKKIILIISEGPTQRLDDTALLAEVKNPINFYTIRKKVCIKSTLSFKQ